MLRRLIIAALFAALLAPIPLLAEESAEEPLKWYDVELIIFSRDATRAKLSEEWPEEQPLVTENEEPPLDLAALPLVSATATLPKERTAMLRLGEEQLQMVKQATKIVESEQLTLLLHTGWRQAGLAREEARLVHLYATPAVDDSATGGARGSASGTDPDLFAQAAHPVELEGVIRVSLSRYLHLNSRLLYRLPLTDEELAERAAAEAEQPLSMMGMGIDETDSRAAETPAGERVATENLFGDGTTVTMGGGREEAVAAVAETEVTTPLFHSFRLEESRRMRSRQLHFLDHPLFGVVVQITPVEITDSDEKSEG